MRRKRAKPSAEALWRMRSHLAASIGRRSRAMMIPTLDEWTPRRAKPTRNVMEIAT